MDTNELKAKIQCAVASLANAVDSNDVIRDYVRFMGRFHKYSFGNQMLIWIQHPGAAQVAGYKAWQKLGRQVRKGEKGIAILVPMTRKVTDSKGEEITKVWFGTGYVFDVSQTDGADLPAQPDWASSEMYPVLQGQLVAYAESIGIQVRVEQPAISGAQGVSYGGTIVLDPGTGTTTLVHELAHELLHQGAKEDRPASRQVRELQAEAVAAVVMSHFGFDTQTSLNYLGLWGVDGDAIKGNLEEIQKAACKIIDAVESYEYP